MTEPTFSVVVPTFDRPEQLGRCLGALEALAYPRDSFEVVVVDDGGRLPLDGVVGRFSSGMRLRLVSKENGGPASARNAGARVAVGTVLAFTDDDCAPEPEWLSSLARRTRACPGSMVGGHTINGLESNPFSVSSQELIAFLYGYYNRDPENAGFFASNNLAVPAAAFEEIGGFDESFPLSAGEDRDFCDRWRASGRRLVYAPDAIVKHFHSLTLRSFWRQHFNYGRGAFHLRCTHRSRTTEARGMERWSFYARLIVYPLRRGFRLSALRGVALTALMQAATASGFLSERMAAKKRV